MILIIHDVTQKKHTVLRNYPVIGRLRFFFEDLGEYFRQYFFAGDRDGDAVQPRDARLGLPARQERRRHHRLRLDQRSARAGLHHLREPRLPGAGGRPAADAVAR